MKAAHGGREGGSSIALDNDQIRDFRADDRAHAFQRACADLIGALLGAHDSQVEIWPDVKQF